MIPITITHYSCNHFTSRILTFLTDSLILQQSSSYLEQGGTELLCAPTASVYPATEYTQRWYMQALAPHTHVPRWHLHITASTWNINKHPSIIRLHCVAQEHKHVGC